jgi:hypothetical protein
MEYSQVRHAALAGRLTGFVTGPGPPAPVHTIAREDADAGASNIRVSEDGGSHDAHHRSGHFARVVT